MPFTVPPTFRVASQGCWELTLSLCRERPVQTVVGEDIKVWVKMWKERSTQETERKTQVEKKWGSKERSREEAGGKL